MSFNADVICKHCEWFASKLCPLIATSVVWSKEQANALITTAKHINWNYYSKFVFLAAAIAVPWHILTITGQGGYPAISRSRLMRSFFAAPQHSSNTQGQDPNDPFWNEVYLRHARMNGPPNDRTINPIDRSPFARKKPKIYPKALWLRRTKPVKGNERILFQRSTIQIVGWPSEGGLIVLEDAEQVDFRYLGLDFVNPPQRRSYDREEEDSFCQALLKLGAIWWSSEGRRKIIQKMANCDWQDDEPHDNWILSDDLWSLGVEWGLKPPPMPHEYTWTCVGWPSTGGLWVAEVVIHPKDYMNEQGFERMRKMSRLKLARTMDERSQLLSDYFGARFYKNVAVYDGAACLNWWRKRFDQPWEGCEDIVNPRELDETTQALEKMEKEMVLP